MTMRRSQMQWSIVSPIGSIDPGTSADEQFSKLSVTFLAAPMKRTEPVVIPNQQDIQTEPFALQSTLNDTLNDCDRLYKPLIHVMLCVVEPNAHLHSVALAAPLKNILHFPPSSLLLSDAAPPKENDKPPHPRREKKIASWSGLCSRRGRAAKNRRALWERWRTPARGCHARK